ncbi:CHRD domain-containing protein [Gelidibacter salicanalis]|uniref:CHRD domain-containing protein n=1 Tax=Gelidibacter salicanalis TaxID=291193 RepID=A0A934KUV9_9FLAO|nr:CHRD domain-containing protein [Gelidibacter salicanalis]MBJ7879835.1 CHRD domain-containing protein [Gelidibacter salicanalis]
MKQSIKFFALLAVIFTMASCSNDDDDAKPDPNVMFETTLTGPKEVPANSSAATGKATLTFNKDTKIFVLNVTHDIANPTAGHIHMAPAGENGAVIFPFTSAKSPISLTSPVLTEEQVVLLNNGLFYVNIHTEAFPGGEIRGNLVKK